MNCMMCSTTLSNLDYCPKCGCNVTAQKQAVRLSNLYYNQGLEKAQIRDLSGAISCLQRSLKLYKLNIRARNLLGLVYFEIGEVVAALGEWVISKNILSAGNPASEYIQKLQSNANKLDSINQTIKKYNYCLAYCRDGNEDMALIQLKKVISQNPKLIKGYHLLALLYIREKSYEKARRLLKNAARIDKTNTTTLRFLREVDEQTGKMTSLEPKFRSKAKMAKEEESKSVYYSGNDIIIQPPAFRESSTVATLLNLGFGLIIGAAALWFLVVPAITQQINQAANQKIVEYSDKVASQSAAISRMEADSSATDERVNTANEQIAQAETISVSYENLMKAYALSLEDKYTAAADALKDVNAEILTQEAKTVYDSIYNNVASTMFDQLFAAGQEAYDSGDFEEAITNLQKAHDMKKDDYETQYYLAHSYYENGDTANADIYLQMIIDNNSGTAREREAKDYLTGTPSEPGTDNAAAGGTRNSEEGTLAGAGPNGAASGNNTAEPSGGEE